MFGGNRSNQSTMDKIVSFGGSFVAGYVATKAAIHLKEKFIDAPKQEQMQHSNRIVQPPRQTVEYGTQSVVPAKTEEQRLKEINLRATISRMEREGRNVDNLKRLLDDPGSFIQSSTMEME